MERTTLKKTSKHCLLSAPVVEAPGLLLISGAPCYFILKQVCHNNNTNKKIYMIRNIKCGNICSIKESKMFLIVAFMYRTPELNNRLLVSLCYD